MEASQIVKYVLIVVFMTSAGGFSAVNVGSYGSREACEAAGQEIATAMEVPADAAKTLDVPSRDVSHYCAPGE